MPEEARTHSLPGYIFRRNLMSHPACQKKPEHTHFLNTFQKEPHEPSSLPDGARTHSQTGHILRNSIIRHLACQKKPEHTHSLDTFSEALSARLPEEARTHSQAGHIFRSFISQLARRSQNTLTSWTHLQKEPHELACQKKPEHTHFLDTFSEVAS